MKIISVHLLSPVNFDHCPTLFTVQGKRSDNLHIFSDISLYLVQHLNSY